MLSELWRSSGIRVVEGGVVAGFHCSVCLKFAKLTHFESRYTLIKWMGLHIAVATGRMYKVQYWVMAFGH